VNLSGVAWPGATVPMWNSNRRQNGPNESRSTRDIRTATPATVRRVNRSIILNLVRLHQPLCRAELSARTGIFRSSVSAIVDELVRDGLLVEQRAKPQNRGRVPVELSLNPDGFRVLGISVRGFRTFVADAGLDGNIGTKCSFSTPSDPAALMRELAGAIGRVRADREQGFRRVGISLPGMVHSDTGEVLMLPSLPAYAGFGITRAVGELAGAPAVAENDCNAGALAELWMNESEVAGLEDFVFVEIGDIGVGAGLILKGELYRGHDRTWVGEFGHMIVDPDGPPCSCGRRGCWETYVADRATWRRYDPRTEYTPARFEGLVGLASDGDGRAARVLRETAEYISLGLSNIAFGLNPEMILIAGEITRVWGLVQQTIETAHCPGGMRLRVNPARFNLDVLSLQGAVVLALQEAYASPELG
jgi:predicted NBD/HSP70 family sugar kinase